jgi:hypothetical protein
MYEHVILNRLTKLGEKHEFQLVCPYCGCNRDTVLRWPFGYRCCIVSNNFSAVMNDELVKAISINLSEWLKAFMPAFVCRK